MNNKQDDWLLKIDYIFDDWLMEHYPEDIHCSDDLIRLSENGDLREAFLEWLSEEW